MKKYNLVYKITNTLNDMIYIGVHSTDNVDNGYMGSGSYLRQHIKEFGVDAFTREILHNFETRDEALLKEAEIVNIEYLKQSNTYNLVVGGNKGISTVKEKRKLFSKSIYSKKAKELRISKDVKIDYNPVNKDYIYVIKPKNGYPKFIETDPDSKVTSLIIDHLNKNVVKFYRALTYCYNDANTQDKTIKIIDRANKLHGYYDNWVIYKHKVNDSFWAELNQTDTALDRFYSR